MNDLTTEKMTSLQIAEITGRKHAHLMRDIREMETAWVDLCKRRFALMFIISKLPNGGTRKDPYYSLSKTETLYIATKFNNEVRAKLILRWEKLEAENQKTKNLSPAERLLESVRLQVEQEKKINEHDNRIKELEAKTTLRPDYYTIAGYGNLNGIKVNIKLASMLGRAASRICKKTGYNTDEIADPRFGKVKMYPKAVLMEVFETVAF